MKKLLRNIFNLLVISTPFFIILNYVKNYFPNYRKKNKNIEIEEKIYNKFASIDISKKWFSNNLYFLEKNLVSQNINDLLEIGSYEGRSAIFFSNLFKKAKITCVDTWQGSDEHSNFNFKQVENNFDINIKNLINNNRIIKFKGKSDNFFNLNKKYFDLIYIDGDHSKDQVKKDIYNSWNVLNKNGFMVIDDYMWWYYKDLKNNPAFPVNDFINNNINQIEKLIIWHQVIIQKK